MTTNTNISPIQASNCTTDTNTPKLRKYTALVHFPVLWVGITRIPAGVEKEVVWGVSPLDACKWMAEHFRAAEWVEVKR